MKRELVKIPKQTRRGKFIKLGGASSRLSAVTSENMPQATRLQSMGDAWSVGMVSEEVKEPTELGIDILLGRERFRRNRT